MLITVSRWILGAVAAVSTAPIAQVLTQTADALPRKPALGAQLQADPQGLKIGNTLPGTSAEGVLKPNDIITSVDGTKLVTNPQILSQIIQTKKTGDKINLIIIRNQKEENIALTLKEKPREKAENYDTIYSHIVSNGSRVRTIITKPKNLDKAPVFLLIQGLGNFSVDYPLSQSGPYSNFLRHFANNGFVTVRVEKPGAGDSEGPNYADLDFNTEADVYLQAIRQIKKADYANPNQIFVFGHSMGGIMGPPTVAKEPVAGFIASSTVFKTWTEYWLENVRRQMLLGGAPPQQVDTELRKLAQITPLVFTEGYSPEKVAQMLPNLKPELDANFPDGKSFQGRTLNFWQQLAAINYPEVWAQVNSPTLVLWGQYDFVSTEEDHKMIAELLNSKTPGLATYKQVPNSDHGYNTYKSYQDAFQGMRQAPAPFNQEVITTIESWINQQIAKSND